MPTVNCNYEYATPFENEPHEYHNIYYTGWVIVTNAARGPPFVSCQHSQAN